MRYPVKKISDLFSDIKIGGTPSRGNSLFFNGTNLWVSIKDMNGQSVITSTAERLSDDGVANSNCKLIKKGSLLFSFKLTVGKVAFAGTDLYTNEAIAAFDPLEAEANGIDLTYLSMVLPIAARSDSTKNSMGALLLSKDRIYDLKIPVPLTIAEQNEIATNLLSKIAEIEKAKKAAEIKRQELQTISIRQQNRALEILEDLPRMPLSYYLDGIEAGKSIKTTELPAKKEELGVLKVSAISWDRFQPDEAKSVIGNYQPRDEHRVKKGDLIISRANTLELVGAVVLVENDYPNRLLSDKTLRLKLKDEVILSEYLLHILKMSESRKHIEENATGTSNSMRNIPQKAIFTIPIPQADKNQQREIIDLLHGTRTLLKKMDKALKIILEDLNALPKKLLEESFNN